MTDPARPSFDRGLETVATVGLVAGTSFLLGQTLLTTLLGGPPLGPVRLMASLILGPAALSRLYPPGLAVVAGVAVNLLLATGYGGVAVLVLRHLDRRRATRLRLLAAGAAFGALVGVVNLLLIGPWLFPQVAVVDLGWNGFLGHAGFFGLALGAALWRARR